MLNNSTKAIKVNRSNTELNKCTSILYTWPPEVTVSLSMLQIHSQTGFHSHKARSNHAESSRTKNGPDLQLSVPWLVLAGRVGWISSSPTETAHLQTKDGWRLCASSQSFDDPLITGFKMLSSAIYNSLGANCSNVDLDKARFFPPNHIHNIKSVPTEHKAGIAFIPVNCTSEQ